MTNGLPRSVVTRLEKVATAREYLRTLDLTDDLDAAIGAEVDEALANENETPSGRLALRYLKADL